MEYTFIEVKRLIYLYEQKLIPTGLMAYNHSWKNVDVKKIYAYVCHSKDNIDKIYGLCVGTVYKPNTINKCSQWIFGENRNRELWIEHLHTDPTSLCKGTDLLNAVEEKLSTHMNEVKRKNIYVVSIHKSVGFYEKCGYNEIWTKDTDEDDDYPSSFVDGACIGTWMAKSLTDNEIDDEELYGFLNDYIIQDSYIRLSTKMLQKYLNFPIDREIFYFLYPNDFTRFKNDTGRKYINYTEDEFKEKYYPKYKNFLKDMKRYEESRDDNILKYFNCLTKSEVKEMLNNYLDTV